MIPGRFLTFPALLLLFCAVPALAAVPYASGDDDRRAKQAVPPSGKALLYIYRAQDDGPSQSPVLRLNDRAVGGLAKGTYLYWAIDPGQAVLRVGDGRAVALRTQGGRIYFVRLTMQADGGSELLQMSYGNGRQGVHNARLVRETAAPKPQAAPTSAPVRSSFNLILKGGSFSLGSASQNIDAANTSGGTTTFRTDFTQAGAAFGLEAEWYIESGWAFGGEVTVHAHDYTTLPVGVLGQGEMQVVTVLFNAKKYFRPGSVVQPFLGVGLGLASVNISGQLEGNTAGVAAQALGGLAFRWEHVGLYTELKYQLATTSDVDVSGAAFMVGLGLHF